MVDRRRGEGPTAPLAGGSPSETDLFEAAVAHLSPRTHRMARPQLAKADAGPPYL